MEGVGLKDTGSSVHTSGTRQRPQTHQLLHMRPPNWPKYIYQQQHQSKLNIPCCNSYDGHAPLNESLALNTPTPLFPLIFWLLRYTADLFSVQQSVPLLEKGYIRKDLQATPKLTNRQPLHNRLSQPINVVHHFDPKSSAENLHIPPLPVSLGTDDNSLRWNPRTDPQL